MKKMSLRGFGRPIVGRSVVLYLRLEGHYCLELEHPWAVVVNLIVTSNHLLATIEHFLVRQHGPHLLRLALRRSRQQAEWRLKLLHSQQWKLAKDSSNYSLSTWGYRLFKCRSQKVPACRS